MLTKEEKEELLLDGRSAKRRDEFSRAREALKAGRPLDEYVSFLDAVQKVFRPPEVSRKETSAKLNRL